MNFNEYTFNKESKQFLSNIEQDYTEEINIISSDLGVGNHAFSKIISGIPTIEINNNYSGNIEGLIIHEAYHLRLRFDGCPDISFASSPDVPLTQQNQQYLIWFYHKSWDKINHHYFYSKIENEMKVNPYIDFEIELRTYIEQQQLPGVNDATRNILLACYYLQTWVETQNEALLGEFEDLLLNIYQGDGIKLGKELIDLFTQSTLRGIDDFVPLFIQVFNACHYGIARLKLKGSEVESMGNYNQNISVLSMWKY